MPGRSSRRGSAAWAISARPRCWSGSSPSPSSWAAFRVARIPGALVLVVGGLVASVCSTLGRTGSRWSDTVPRGLPLPQVPSLDVVSQNFPAVVIAAFALLLIGFSQTAGDAQAFATKHRYRVDLNQESVAQGMANLGAGVFQGMPVSTSLSASSLNESAGARTPVASIATGGIVVATLILLAPLFSDLPKAILAAVIIDAVVFGMIDIAEFRRLLPGQAVRLLDRDGGAHGRAVGGRSPGRRRRHGAVPALADPRHDAAVDADPGSRTGHARVPRSGREPGRRDRSRAWR